MATEQEQRKMRLEHDFKEMKNIRGPMIQWRVLSGDPPEEYEVTINVRSITGPQPDYRDQHVVRVRLPAGYPRTAPPQIVMLSEPQVFHPNWYTDARWCYGSWVISEGLGHNVLRMIRTLQYDMEITNEHSPANSTAKDWYLQNYNSGLFPCDTQILPDPTKSKFSVQPTVKKRFSIQN